MVSVYGTVWINKIGLTGGERVTLEGSDGENRGTATVVRFARLGALGDGVLVIETTSGDVMEVRSGLRDEVYLRDSRGDLPVCPEQWVPVIELDDVPLVTAA